jgi:hypothetical protein
MCFVLAAESPLTDGLVGLTSNCDTWRSWLDLCEPLQALFCHNRRHRFFISCFLRALDIANVLRVKSACTFFFSRTACVCVCVCLQMDVKLLDATTPKGFRHGILLPNSGRH